MSGIRHNCLGAAAWIALVGCGSDPATSSPTDAAVDAVDVSGDTAADARADADEDVGEDVAPDIAPDTVADVAPDAVADVAPDVAPDTLDDVPEPTCDVVSDSTLPGVTIELSDEQCVFSAAELAEGVVFRWQIEVSEPLDNVRPRPLDAGRCFRPGDSGLIELFSIRGNEQGYCRCDVGLCPPFEDTLDLVPGTWTGFEEWTGRNWSGPSDTGNPLGDPFPPGDYTALVRAEGVYTVGEDGPEIPFQLSSSMAVRVVP